MKKFLLYTGACLLALPMAAHAVTTNTAAAPSAAMPADATAAQPVACPAPTAQNPHPDCKSTDMPAAAGASAMPNASTMAPMPAMPPMPAPPPAPKNPLYPDAEPAVSTAPADK